MALKATIFKADLSIYDMTRNYYHSPAMGSNLYRLLKKPSSWGGTTNVE